MTITSDEALAIATRLLDATLDEYGATVELVEVEGGWYARVVLPPERQGVMGVGRTYVADDGRTFRYPSSKSPRMANAAFQADRVAD